MEKEIIHKKDFVEVEYTGRLKDGPVFDTTSAEVAKKEGIFNESAVYGPVIICIGEGHILKALDSLLEKKEVGKEYKFELSPEKAFGKKDAKLLRLISLAKFRGQEIRPMPGLQVVIDGAIGVVRSVTSGRVIVDFNHPLAGKEVVYDIKVNKTIKEDKEKISALLRLEVGLSDAEVVVEEKNAKVNSKTAVPKEISDRFEKRVSELTPIEKIEFITQESNN